MLERWQTMINSNSELNAHMCRNVHIWHFTNSSGWQHYSWDTVLFVCLFSGQTCHLRVMFVCVHTSSALQHSVYIRCFYYLCLMCTAIQYHTCMQVGLSLCVLMCVHIHILYVHMALCHREKGGVYPSFPVHFLEIMTAISSSQWLMTGRTNR